MPKTYLFTVICILLLGVGNEVSAKGFRSYFLSNRRGGKAIYLTEVKNKRGAVRKLKQPRRVAEVLTSMEGLSRYMSHVKKDTVEILFNPGSPGHMMVRVGDRFFDLGQTMSAGDQPFVSKMLGYSATVGAVYKVKAEQIRPLQELFSRWVLSANRANLPIFDGYGKPVSLTRSGNIFKVASRGTKFYSARGYVQAELVEVEGKPMLRSTIVPEVMTPVLSQKKNGKISVDSTTCNSFVMKGLQKGAPQLKLGSMGDFAQRFSCSAIVKLVRGDAPVTPDLITVYNNEYRRGDIRQIASDIGKKKKW